MDLSFVFVPIYEIHGMATEKVKRLTPLPETLRELFLKSGNCCAFPGCQRLMMNSEGVFIGQVCHIESAEEGGERFNAAQTNEERRHFLNLMLMCYDHHTITNDVTKYTVAALHKMKADHEMKFTDIAKAIGETAVNNPLHVIIELLIQYYRALDQVHHARTVQAWEESLDEWRTIHPTIWASSPSNRNDTIRNLADPAKAWLSCINSRYVTVEDFDLVEECVYILSSFAISASPMAMPEIYSKTYSTEEKLWERWTEQGNRLLALHNLVARLKELAARAGATWISKTLVQPESERQTEVAGPLIDAKMLRT
ncbi:MAG: hypothetical protein ACKVP0_20010 [Pirellulaceae bacterium]